MTVVHNTNTSGGLDLFSMCCGGVSLTCHARGGATVIAATGEIDASNLDRFADYAQRYVRGDRPLIIDLSELDFLAAQGIRAFFDIDGRCADAGVHWALVPGHPVNRLLRICDKDGRLPTVSSVDEALERFARPGGMTGLLKLVTKAR
jgi:anti-anti-sigma factor